MKLFSIVETLDSKQKLGFLTYINLYHKPKSVICNIAEWLHASKKWNQKNEGFLKGDELYRQSPFTFPTQTFSNALAILGNLAEEYIGWIVWKGSPQNKRSCQLTALAQNSLTDLYVKLHEVELSKTRRESFSIWDEFYRMQTLFNNYYYAITPTENKYFDEFADLLKSLKKATATISQLLFIEIKNREKLLSEPWTEHKDFFDLVCNEETRVKELSEDLILMNNNADLKAYNYLMDIIWSDERIKYSKHMQYSIVAYAENYLLGVTKEGEDRAHELLDLYEHSIKHGFYTLNDTITLAKFLNIIGVASKLGKDEWARKLVDNWAHKVDQKNVKSIHKFGHASIDFHLKKYEKVIHALAQMKTSNFQHKLTSRWLYLRAQFELNRDYIDAIKTQINNFRRFLIANNSKINKQTFEGLKATLKILNMLLDRKNIEYIKDYYRSTKYIFERKWIIEKIKNPA